ncbi:MAG: preprotein translocase subunit SecE [Actinomycetota bacterium]|nr:preprotein translocase subunit SecE [Actinomycetota bacterium]
MARNRKRAKERRARRPPSGNAGVAVARGGRDEHGTAPAPIEHATPDVDLAEAQLALGRPELTGEQTPAEVEALTEAEEQEEELADYPTASGLPGVFPGTPHIVSAPDESEEFADEDRLEGGFDEDDEPALDAGRGGRRGRGGGGDFGGDGDGSGGELGPPSAPVPAPRVLPGGRLVNFLRGSWRELHRVQWPDRRQVVQATGVVLGFVIVAGLFLGGADWVAGKLITLVLK